MPTLDFTPLIFPCPTVALPNAVRISLNPGDVLQKTRILRVDGYLAALTSGTFQAVVTSLRDGSPIATLAWGAGGGFKSSGGLDIFLELPGEGIVIAPGTLGVGANMCILTIWTIMEF